MSDDMNKKIKQIAEMLGQDNMPDNIKGLLSLLASSSSSESSQPKASEPPAPKHDRAERSDLEDNIEMMRRVKKVMDKMNSKNDPRINLLTAIRPFLNSSRQKKLGDCIRILQMTSLTKLVDDSDKGNT